MGRGDTSLRGNAYICRRINKGSMKQLEWERKMGRYRRGFRVTH